MDPLNVSLCFPDQEKSCFGCCPPIRPAGYEHIQHKNIIKRVLRENVKLFKNQDRTVVPITGFSCWALGYLDRKCKLIGCMLHPGQNDGEDLRFRIDYGVKCQRETCYEEKIFSLLNPTHQKFWLQLAKGLDSFSYSSREKNSLFMMMGWGAYLTGLIATNEYGKSFTRESFFRSYKFFTSDLPPRSTAYPLNKIITKENTDTLKHRSFVLDFKVLQNRIAESVATISTYSSKGPYVHLLDIDPLFSDYLRLYLHIPKMEMDEVVKLKKIVDEELAGFRKET